MWSNVNFNMLQSLKPFHCPSCNYCFTCRDSARIHNVSRFPLILDCGHTVCESCLRNALKSQQKIVCTLCQKSTEFPNGDTSKLMPDVYVLGIVSANLKQALPSVKMRLMPTSPSAINGTLNRKDAFVICDICSVKEASFRCKKCQENFCNTCFDSFHKNRKKNYRKHEAVPVYSNVYSAMVKSGCPEHDNRAIEFFCEEDNELICSLCVVTGSHKGHPVLTLLEKNKSCSGDLQKARESAIITSKRLKFTEQKLSQAIPSEKIDNSQWVKEIHNHFHSLHTALILRENELISQIEDICIRNVSQLENMRQEVSDSFKDFDAVLRDAELVLENAALSISVPTIVKKLESAKSVPCHLYPIPYEEDFSKGISLEFKPELHETIMLHGKISADIKPKYCLKSTDELPTNFIVEPIPVEIIPTDTESTASDSYSEDSLSSNVSQLNISLPLKLEYYASKQEKVHVSHIRDPTCFFVVRSSESRKLKILLEKISRWCRSSEADKHIPSALKEGDLYLVSYSVDGRWYRGRVKRMLPPGSETELLENTDSSSTKVQDSINSHTENEQMAEIFYVDFGNTEIVPVSRMRNIQTQFLNLSGMAKKCSLFDIVPINGMWSIAAITTFRDFVHEKEVNMQVMEERGGVLYVDLSQAAVSDITNDVPVSVRDALVFLEHGCFKADTKANKSRRNRNLRQFLPPEEIRANTKTNILVSHVESPSRFYVQQFATSRHLSDLILEMKKFYEDETNILHAIYVPYIGMMCAAQYKKDDFWYRAEVIGLPGGAKVEVQYIDFGNREVLHHRYIRKLMDRFTKLSTQAILCSLADVTFALGTSWSTEAKVWFANFVEKKHLTLLSLGMISGNKVTKAVLYENDTEVCVNGLLVSQAFASSTGHHSKVVKVRKRATKTLSPPKRSINKCPEPDSMEPSPEEMDVVPAVVAKLPESIVTKDEPKNHVKVHVSYVESPGRFYVRIAEQTEERFKRLMKALQDVYVDFDCLPTTICIGTSYAVFRNSDKTWYRGFVMEKTDDLFKVRFVDIGFVEMLPADSFRILLKQHGVDEAFSVECHFANILPAGDSSKWPQIAIDTFKELIAPHDILYLIGEGAIEKSSMPCDLLYKEVIRGGALEPSRVQFQSIRDKLLENGVALRMRKPKVPVAKLEPPLSPSSTCSSVVSNSSPITVIMPSLSPKNAADLGSVERSTIQLITSRPASPRLPSFQWKTAPAPTKMNFLCQPTHVSDDGCIYIQPKPENTGKVELITKALECKYLEAKSEKLRISPPVGEAVAARFALDKKWYRAEIVSDNLDKIKVQFVDFGNYEIVQLDDLRLDVPMKEMPRLSLESELFDTKPAEGTVWPSSVLDFIHETIVDQECLCEILMPLEADKRLQVSLTLQDLQTNISSLLKDIGKAVTLSEYEQRMQHEASGSCQVKDKTVYQVASRLKSDEPFRVCVTQLLEPNVVCIQWLKTDNPSSEEDNAHNEELDRFLQLMDELAAKAEHFRPLTDPEQGLACCAKYSYDNNWYRCEIMRICSEGVEVYYVDYGNSEILPLDRLRIPEPHVLEFPVQAHICKLHGLQPIEEDWSTEATKALIDKLFHTDLQIYAKTVVRGKTNEIDLLVKTPNGDLDLLYKDIIEQGLVDCFIPLNHP